MPEASFLKKIFAILYRIDLAENSCWRVVSRNHGNTVVFIMIIPKTTKNSTPSFGAGTNTSTSTSTGGFTQKLTPIVAHNGREFVDAKGLREIFSISRTHAHRLAGMGLINSVSIRGRGAAKNDKLTRRVKLLFALFRSSRARHRRGAGEIDLRVADPLRKLVF